MSADTSADTSADMLADTVTHPGADMVIGRPDLYFFNIPASRHPGIPASRTPRAAGRYGDVRPARMRRDQVVNPACYSYWDSARPRQARPSPLGRPPGLFRPARPPCLAFPAQPGRPTGPGSPGPSAWPRLRPRPAPALTPAPACPSAGRLAPLARARAPQPARPARPAAPVRPGRRGHHRAAERR
ncbi:hypothetical protein GCM10029964_029670 [Kibdelosporangium lantanae]